MLPRVLEPETLDHLAPDDPVAQRSRRDLRRVNAFMGARRILVRAMTRAVGDARARPLRILELGCGDGRLMLEVAKHRGERWPGARLDLLDRQPIVDAATIAAYAAAGWQARPLVSTSSTGPAPRQASAGTSSSPTSFSIISTARRCAACCRPAPIAPTRLPPASRGAAGSRWRRAI